MRIAALVVVFSMLASSCGVGPCTAIGCQNGVTYVLTQTMSDAFGLNQAVTVKVCIGSDCQTGVLTNTGGGSTSSTNPALNLFNGTITRSFTTRLTGAQDVSIEMTKGTDVVGTDMRSVTFTDFSPNNGPGCGPVCQSSKISL